jgi:hypothetical protein
LSRLGLITDRQKLFPTHRPGMIPHGRKTKNPTLQILVGAASLLLVSCSTGRCKRPSLGKPHCEVHSHADKQSTDNG